MDDIEKRLMGFTNSVSLVLTELLAELSKTGAISGNDFSERLLTTAKQLEIEWRDAPYHWDFTLLKALADGLKPEYSNVIVDDFPKGLSAENDDPPKPDNENR